VSPTLARRFPVGLGDAPLPATTSTAGIFVQRRTTSFPWYADDNYSERTTDNSTPLPMGTVTLESFGSAWRARLYDPSVSS
jgi:hypothetical protein